MTALHEALAAKAEAGQLQAAAASLRSALASKVDRQECEQLLARKLDIRTFLSTQASIGESLSPTAAAAASAGAATAAAAPAQAAGYAASEHWSSAGGLVPASQQQQQLTPQLPQHSLPPYTAALPGSSGLLHGLTPARARASNDGGAGGATPTFRAGDLSNGAALSTSGRPDQPAQQQAMYKPYMHPQHATSKARAVPAGGYNCEQISPATVRATLESVFDCDTGVIVACQELLLLAIWMEVSPTTLGRCRLHYVLRPCTCGISIARVA